MKTKRKIHTNPATGAKYIISKGRKLFGAAMTRVLDADRAKGKPKKNATKSPARSAKASTKPRRKNAKEYSASTPISVTRHYRSGGPNYATARQRIIQQGQRDLFAPEASIEQQLAWLRRNPSVLDAVKSKYGDPKQLSNAELKRAMKAVLKARLRRNPNIDEQAATLEQLEAAYESFQGREPDAIDTVDVPKWMPREFYSLGDLVEVHITDGSTDKAQRVLEFADTGAKLVADATDTMFILGGTFQAVVNGGLPVLELPYEYAEEAIARGLPRDAVALGYITHVVYHAFKPHLHPQPSDWIHKLGEEGGALPVLCATGGHLVILGGDYTIEPEGIRN